MKLETLHIDQFGKFSEASFSFSEVTVFYGPNESGKTTLFDAILMQLCKPTKTTKLGKTLHQRYRKRISCRLQLASSSEVFDEPLNSDDFMNLQAIRAGDVHLELDDKRSWVQQLKQKLSGVRIAPELIYKALEPIAATGSNRTINKEIADLEARKLRLTREIELLSHRRNSLLRQESENAQLKERLYALKANQIQTLKEIKALEEQLSHLRQAINREDMERELDKLYSYQHSASKLRSLQAFSGERQIHLHQHLEAEQDVDEKLREIGKRILQVSNFKPSTPDVISLGFLAALALATYFFWPAADLQKHSTNEFYIWAQSISPIYLYTAIAAMMALLLSLRLRKHTSHRKSLGQTEYSLVAQKTAISSSIHQILVESGARSPKEFDHLAAAREAQEQIIHTHYHHFPFKDDEPGLERAIKEFERKLNHFDDQQIHKVDHAKQRYTDLESKLLRLRASERETIEQIIALEAEFQRKVGEVKGAFGEIPEKILELEKSQADVQEQLEQKFILKQGAATALSILDDIIHDSDMDFERLALLTNHFIGKFLNERNISMTKLDLQKITFTDQYSHKQKPEHLSSGTRDLFVFALRLVLFAQLAPRVPLLIFDDPFIHLDKQRTDLALEMLRYFTEEEVSGTQMILFTKSLDLASRITGKFQDSTFIKL